MHVTHVDLCHVLGLLSCALHLNDLGAAYRRAHSSFRKDSDPLSRPYKPLEQVRGLKPPFDDEEPQALLPFPPKPVPQTYLLEPPDTPSSMALISNVFLNQLTRPSWDT